MPEPTKEVVKNENNNESYIVEGISLTAFAEAISPEDIDKINKFTVKPVESKDVVVYTALLIDDKITRNNTLYNKDFQSMLLSLPTGEGNFIGAPILFGETKDHQQIAASQVGRIFDAWQVVSKEKNYGVMAKIYVLRETNEDLITKVDSGVLKELSISTKVEMPLCSICAQNINACEHQPGVNGCHVIMSGKGFVAEASFVAVPGASSAKILNEDETKNFLRLENLRELVAPLINESLELLKPANKEVTDAMDIKLTALSSKYDEMILKLEEISKKFNESETVVYPFDMLSALKNLKKEIETGKAFVIKTMAKYNIQGADFRNDPIPDMEQGLRGEDTNLIVKILFDNINILGVNLSKIESHLKLVPLPSNATFTGDTNDLVNTVRFMNDKIEDIKTRIYKLQGKFDLELEQRNQLISETIKFGILTKRFNFSEKNLSEKFFDNFTTEEIQTIKEEWFKEGSKIYTPEVIVSPVNDETKPKEVTKSASPREIAQKIKNGGNTNV